MHVTRATCRPSFLSPSAWRLRTGLCVFSLLAGPATRALDVPELRLPETARPLRQTLELTLEPDRESFTGQTRIEVEVRSATRELWLHARGLEVTEAALVTAGGSVRARPEAVGVDFLALRFDSPAGPGAARIELSFRGPISRREFEGLFAQREGGTYYLFTQFQPIAARKAFPCFDEPSYKIPWQVTLRVPTGLVALANTPEVSSNQEGRLRVVRFAETRPLPSYLVAIAVGPFDLVDLGPAGAKQTPLRLAVPRGRGGDVRWAKDSTPTILGLLEDYFGRAYPYEKLDQVAIPGVGFAMEHPGLVTYGQGLLVEKAGEETLTVQRAYASVCAHELAHMWFGNLVTMAFWDDTWLNEAFASWIGEKTIARFRPDWRLEVTRVRSRSHALRSDSLATARRIRQPIETSDDIRNAFDSITYSKGEAVLEMFEAWLGPEVFREGVLRHLAAHEWGNATARDFLAALSAAAGRDVSGPFSSFLDQTGAPVVSASRACSTGGSVSLSQKPYRSLGSPDGGPRTWQVPVCVKHAVKGGPGRSCVLLAERTATLDLGGACPDWIFPNAAAAGYFRGSLGHEDLERVLAEGRLDPAERVGLLGDLQALVASGDIPAADALEVVARFANDSSREVVSTTLDLVLSLDDLVPVSSRPRLAALVRELYGPRARQLGFAPRPGEDEDTRLLRRSLISAVGDVGGDPEIGAQAVALTKRWLADPKAIDPDLVDVVLALGARYGGAVLFEPLKAELLKTDDRTRREKLLVALGCFREPALLDASLRLALADGIDPRESVIVPFVAASDPATRRASYAFVRANFDALARRLPEDYALYLPSVGTRLCDDEDKADFVASFKERTEKLPGGPRIFSQYSESLDQCIALKKAQAASVESFLARR